MNKCSYIHRSVSQLTDSERFAASEVTDVCEPGHQLDEAQIVRLRARLVDSRIATTVADVFKLLGDLTRVRILDALTPGERCVCDIAAVVGLSESAVSHQLRLLRAARLVRVRRSGRLAFYSLDDHHVAGLVYDTRKHVEEEA